MNKKYRIINDNGEGIYEVVCDKSNIRYYVNEQKKTVAAVMEDAVNEFRNELDRLLDKTFGFTWETNKYYDYALHYIKRVYRGKAHCIRNDVFDVETGMRVAREHMLANYYLDRTIAFGAVLEKFEEFLSELDYRTEMSFERAEKFILASDAHYDNAHSELE